MEFNYKIFNVSLLFLTTIINNVEGVSLPIEIFNRNYFESGFLSNKLVSKNAIKRRNELKKVKEKILNERFEETTKKVIENGITTKQIIRIADDGKGTRKKTIINKTINREGEVFTDRKTSVEKY